MTTLCVSPVLHAAVKGNKDRTSFLSSMQLVGNRKHISLSCRVLTHITLCRILQQRWWVRVLSFITLGVCQCEGYTCSVFSILVCLGFRYNVVILIDSALLITCMYVPILAL